MDRTCFEMIKNSRIWIVTDVDGTLMDHSYDLTPAKNTILRLKELKIPVILCTSKTASEVKVIQKDLGLNDPYIVENGAAIYSNSVIEGSWEIILGESYQKLEYILKKLSYDIDFQLIPLNDLSDSEANSLTGLSGNSLNLMRDRHWSMPFLNPPDHLEEDLKQFCKNYEVVIFRGNRMSHLLSKNSSKGKAIKKLKEFSKNSNVKIIGLGDSPNDLPLLQEADYRVVISSIDGPNKKLLEDLNDLNYVISAEPHGVGWQKEVKNILRNLIPHDYRLLS